MKKLGNSVSSSRKPSFIIIVTLFLSGCSKEWWSWESYPSVPSYCPPARPDYDTQRWLADLNIRQLRLEEQVLHQQHMESSRRLTESLGPNESYLQGRLGGYRDE